VIHDPARRPDDDLNASLQAPKLPLIRLAAVDRQRLDLFVTAVAVQRLRYLDREFAGWGQDEGLHCPALGVDRLNNGQAKRRGFSGTRLGLSNDVAAGQQNRNRLDLNG